MKRLFFVMLLAVGLVACGGNADKSENVGVATTINGEFRACDAEELYLERFDDDLTSVERIASVELTEEGEFELCFDVAQEGFYRLSFSNEARPVVLVVAPGDNLTVAAEGDVFNSYSVEGSAESALICEFNHAYFGYCDELATKFIGADDMDEELAQELYDLATAAMQYQVKFIGTHSDRLASFYAINHANVEALIPTLYGKGISAVHRRALLEGLRTAYPDSPVVGVLEQRVADDDAIVRLEESVKEVSYPDLHLEDIYRRSHRLSDLAGNVVLLYFWSSEINPCLDLNEELKPLYEKYHNRGFEIYHVAADLDRSLWIQTVRQQKLPWISLFGGENFSTFATYNVQTLPMCYLIDRNGDIEPCGASVEEIERAVVKQL